MSKLKLAVAVLDIGTTGVRMLVGRMMENGSSKIIAKAEAGVPGGIDFSLSDCKVKLNNAVATVLDTILQKTGIEVKSCYVSVPNNLVKMVGSSGEISIIPRAAATCLNIGELLNEASAVSYGDDETIIDIVPVAFYADGKVISGKPEGVECSTLSIDANALITKTGVTETIGGILGDLGVKVDGLVPAFFSNQKVFDSFAFSNGTRNCMTAMVDVGGDRTEVSVYYNGIPFAFDSIGMGGNDITRDLAYVLDVSENQAQRLKMEFCYASSAEQTTASDVLIDTVASGETSVKASYIADIMNARIAEITDKAYEKALALMKEAGCGTAPLNKVFFIGDGIVHFKGINRVLADELGIDSVEAVDKGKDLGIKNSFTNALGMILYVSSKIKYGRRSSLVINRDEELQKNQESENESKGLWSSIKAKVKGFFDKISQSVKQMIEKLKS